MINNYNLETKYIFGEGAIESIEKIINELKSKNILILYGYSSIKKNGILNLIYDKLNKIKNINCYEFNGIEPNPKHDTINKAIEYCRKNKIDLILAVGGGSVIDAAKVIGVLTSNKDIKCSWDYVKNGIAKNPSIPIVSILTIAGTGSENNAGSVISNNKLKMKLPVFSQSAIPKYAILDPTFTNSLSKWQLASGIFDCFSHLLEQYYGKNTFEWTKNIIIANIKTLLKSAKTIFENDLYDYDARANLMWTASMSLNSTTSFNSETDWNVHAIEHGLSALWDITHGAGLALLTPTYIKYRSEKEKWFKEKTILLSKEIFNNPDINYFYEKLLEFIRMLGLPRKFTDFEEIKSINNRDINFIVDHAIKQGITIDPLYVEQILKQIDK